MRFSDNGTDRLKIYKPSLDAADCQIVLDGLRQEALFFDPFDQLMRLQLLCSAMEREGEMDPDVVSLLHIAPKSNREFVKRVTSPALRSIGCDVHEVWGKLVEPGHFAGVYAEDVLPLVCRHAPEPEWATYMTQRFGAWARLQLSWTVLSVAWAYGVSGVGAEGRCSAGRAGSAARLPPQCQAPVAPSSAWSSPGSARCCPFHLFHRASQLWIGFPVRTSF